MWCSGREAPVRVVGVPVPAVNAPPSVTAFRVDDAVDVAWRRADHVPRAATR